MSIPRTPSYTHTHLSIAQSLYIIPYIPAIYVLHRTLCDTPDAWGRAIRVRHKGDRANAYDARCSALLSASRLPYAAGGWCWWEGSRDEVLLLPGYPLLFLYTSPLGVHDDPADALCHSLDYTTATNS